MSRLMTQEEAERFKEQVKKNWANTPLSYLKTALEANLRLKQQIEIRNKVMEELINERTSPEFFGKNL